MACFVVTVKIAFLVADSICQGVERVDKQYKADEPKEFKKTVSKIEEGGETDNAKQYKYRIAGPLDIFCYHHVLLFQFFEFLCSSALYFSDILFGNLHTNTVYTIPCAALSELEVSICGEGGIQTGLVARSPSGLKYSFYLEGSVRISSTFIPNRLSLLRF